MTFFPDMARPGKTLPVTELTDRQLIDLILEIHHAPERALWLELDQLVNKILLVHYEHGKDQLLTLHDGAGLIIKRIILDTNDFTPLDYACPTMKAVYRKLYELADDIFLHIAKENSVLFKRYE